MEAYFAGANFVMKERETGDVHNSPTVCKKYAKKTQYIADFPNSTDEASFVAKIIKT